MEKEYDNKIIVILDKLYAALTKELKQIIDEKTVLNLQ